MRAAVSSSFGQAEVHRPPVDDVERRAARAVVVDRIGVEGGDDGAVLGQLACGDRPGAARVDPALERGDDHGRVELWRLLEPIQVDMRRGYVA